MSVDYTFYSSSQTNWFLFSWVVHGPHLVWVYVKPGCVQLSHTVLIKKKKKSFTENISSPKKTKTKLATFVANNDWLRFNLFIKTLKCQDLLIFYLIHNCKLNNVWFWTDDQATSTGSLLWAFSTILCHFDKIYFEKWMNRQINNKI